MPAPPAAPRGRAPHRILLAGDVAASPNYRRTVQDPEEVGGDPPSARDPDAGTSRPHPLGTRVTRPPGRGTARRQGRRPGAAAPAGGPPAARSGRRGGGSQATRQASAPPPSGAAPAARWTRSPGGPGAG